MLPILPIRRVFFCAVLTALAGSVWAADNTSISASGEWIYTVQPGDTLSHIANQHLANAKAWKQLQSLNKVANPNLLTPGRTLRIPDSLSNMELAQADAVLVRGDVMVSRGVGTPSAPLVTGEKLRVGSTIETGGNGILTLRFVDQSRMLVSPNSRVTLTHLQLHRVSGAGVTQASVEHGSVESTVNPQKVAGARYEIKTPALNLAVRGTVFRVQFDSQTNTTRSSVLEGLVQAGNGKGQVAIGAGYGNVATLGNAPGALRALLPSPSLASASSQINYFPARFDWDGLKDVSQYRVEIMDGSAGDRLMLVRDTRDLHSVWAELPNGDYRIRVRGVDADGLEGRDSSFAFKVAAWPVAPMVHVPLEGSVVAGEKINFHWTRVADADFWRFQVARDAKFEDIVVQFKSLTSISDRVSALLKPGRYYWRVAAGKNVGGVGPFGAVQSFEVAETAKTDTANRLRWQAASAGERYKVQVAKRDSFDAPLLDTELATTELQLPNVTHAVYVRMKRITQDGIPGNYEPVQTFEPAQ